MNMLQENKSEEDESSFLEVERPVKWIQEQLLRISWPSAIRGVLRIAEKAYHDEAWLAKEFISLMIHKMAFNAALVSQCCGKPLDVQPHISHQLGEYGLGTSCACCGKSEYYGSTLSHAIQVRSVKNEAGDFELVGERIPYPEDSNEKNPSV